MRVKILASESMGVRSMATFIEMEKLKVIIDPSCALTPRRYGLPPHKLEFIELRKRFELINFYLKKADIVIITHFHYDHFSLDNVKLYEGKKVFIKDPEKFSHEGLKRRGERFINALPEKIELNIADGRSFIIGDVKIIFSSPLFHGNSAIHGYVLSVCIDDGKNRFLHSSDVQGINTEEQLNFINFCEPDLLFLDGFPTYLIGIHYTEQDFRTSLNFLKQARTGTLIIDHHLTRDRNFRALMKNIEFLTAAEYMGEEPVFLEARRKELFKFS